MQRLFNRFRDNHIAAVRAAVRHPRRVDGHPRQRVLRRGLRRSGLPLGDEFKGIGILYGLTDDAPTVRTYLADGEDAEVICLAARKLREKARTLSGDALGVEVDEPESDIVADLLEVMGGDSGLWWETAAERLAAEFPMRHADATAESVSAAARARGIPSDRRPVAARPRRAPTARDARRPI